MKLWSFCLVLFSLLGGCTAPEAPPPANLLRLAIGEDPITLDPRKGGDVLSSTLHFFLFEGLIKLEEDGSFSPAQCSSYTLSPDRRTYTFTLGESFWSNGEVVTADDFERTWKQVLSPSFPAPNAHLFYPIKGAELAKKGLLPLDDVGIHAVDPHTLVVELESPTPYFLSLLSFCSFFPVHQKATFSQEELICNGPFMLTKRMYEREILLSKNPLYLHASTVKLEGIRLSVIKSERTALQLYEKGEIDFLGEPFSSLSPEAWELLPQDEIFACPLSATTLITFNTTTTPFSNVNLRRALHLALNRGKIATHALTSKEKPALCLIPPPLRQGKSKVLFEDDQKELALQLLEKGLKEEGLTKSEFEHFLCYLYTYTPSNHVIAQLLQEEWRKKLDLHVSLQKVDQKTLLNHLGKKNYTFAQALCRSQYADPLSLLERFLDKESAKNYPGWEHKDYQKLIKHSFEKLGKARLELLDEAEQCLMEDLPLSPLFHLSLCYAKKPHVQGISYSPSGGIFFERLFLAP